MALILGRTPFVLPSRFFVACSSTTVKRVRLVFRHERFRLYDGSSRWLLYDLGIEMLELDPRLGAREAPVYGAFGGVALGFHAPTSPASVSWSGMR